MLLRKWKEMVKKIKKNSGLDEYNVANIPENKIIEKSETEWQEELEALKPAVRRKLTEVYGCIFHDWWIEQTCKEMLDDMPKELYQNVWEWIEDKPISEIRVGELSIKQIMEYTKHGFLDCAELMCRYVKRGCADEEGILGYYELLWS